MKTMKVVWLLMCPLLPCCNSQSTKGVDEIIDSYKAIVFTEPGQHDGGVDILANGGKLTARLFPDFKVEGYLMMPAGIDSNYPPTDTNYTGIYSRVSDTVQFKNTGTPLDPLSPFLTRGARLESLDRPGRWAGYKLILEKQ